MLEDHLAADTVVVGVGNTILSDDGVGVHAVRLLEADARRDASVCVIDGGTLGLELMPYLSEARRILVLDAADSGAAPGTLIRMTGVELLANTTGRGVHSLGVADLVAALALMAEHAQEIVLLGVQPATTHCGTALSPDVERAVPTLVDAALDQLTRWCVDRPT